MIKKFVAGLSLFISALTYSQQGTASPYSFYGIGDLKFKGTIENRSMGGISVFSDSIHLNLQNPAHYSNLKLSTYTVGGTLSKTNLTNSTDNNKTNRTSLDYFAAAFPYNKFAFAIGLAPFTSVGYKVQELNSQNILSKYDGIGGINKVFAGFSYKISKNFNFGMDFQYNFGNIETTNLIFQDNIQYGTKEFNRSNLRGYNINYGISYQSKFTDKTIVYSGLTFSPETDLKVSNERNVKIIQFISNDTQITIENQDIAVDNKYISLPSKLVFGLGFSQPKKWGLGGEIIYSKSEVMSNRTDDIINATFENAIRYNFGGFYIPKYNSYKNYFSKITYRGGFRYENTGLILNNTPIEDFAFTFGAGLPLGNSFSSLNLGIEYGKRGTISNNLIRENYLNFSVGISLSDRWFIKRTID